MRLDLTSQGATTTCLMNPSCAVASCAYYWASVYGGRSVWLVLRWSFCGSELTRTPWTEPLLYRTALSTFPLVTYSLNHQCVHTVMFPVPQRRTWRRGGARWLARWTYGCQGSDPPPVTSQPCLTKWNPHYPDGSQPPFESCEKAVTCSDLQFRQHTPTTGTG